MYGDIYTSVKFYQKGILQQSAREQLLRNAKTGRPSSASGFRRFIITVANFMAAFF